MADVNHGDLTPPVGSGIHIAPRWQVADATARAALTLASKDIDGICSEASTGLWYRLQSISPAVWVLLGDASSTTVAANTTALTLLNLFNPATNQILSAAPQPSATATFQPVTAGGVFGTGTARVPDNTTYGSRKHRIGYVSSASASQSAGPVFYTFYAGNTGYFSRETGFALKLAGLLAAVSTTNTLAMGVHTGLPNLTVPSNLLNSFFLGFDSGDANCQIMYNDASGTCTKVDLGTNFPARTAGDFFDVLFWCAQGSATINYTVNRHTSAGAAFTASNTFSGANVPAAGAQWSPMCCVNNGSAGGAIAIDSTGVHLAIPF
jgi:hypothetical protein